MAGPTAAESLIKAAAAGEGEREGGGERRKRWKEVGGSTGPRPPAQNRHALRTREPDPPRVRDQEYQVDPSQGAMGRYGVCEVSFLLDKRNELGAPGRRP